MTEYEYNERAAEDDGCRNEFQRAAAWSAMQPVKDDRQKIAALLAEGLIVAVRFSPRHCRTTDAVIGETQHIICFGDSYQGVLDGACQYWDRHADADDRLAILPSSANPPAPAPTLETFCDDGDVPF